MEHARHRRARQLTIIRGGEGPRCYWVTLDYDPSVDDGPIYADYGIEPPPEGVDVIWQTMECSDGNVIDDFRWILAPTPAEIAVGVRGRIAGTLPEPVVALVPCRRCRCDRGRAGVR